MLDLFDLVSPRVYVISEKHYEDMLKKEKDDKRKSLEDSKAWHLRAIEKLDRQLEALNSNH